jgi:hypothetical protein
MSERLTKRDENGNAYYDWGCLNRNHWALGRHVDRLAAYEDSGLSPEEVQELAKAKAEGRLVVLPCKVGTRVWVIGQDCDLCHDMYTEEPCLFGDCEYRKVIESVFLPGMTDNFGKTVFLTREEAEKALLCNKKGDD